MNRKLQPLLTLAASLLAGSLIGQDCSAGPITIFGGYQLEQSSPVTLNTLFGPHMAYQSTPQALGTYDFGTGTGPVNTGTASYLTDRLSSFTLNSIGDSAQVAITLLRFANTTTDAVAYSGFGANATGFGHVTSELNPAFAATGTERITRTSDTGGTFTATYNLQISFFAQDGTLLSTSPTLVATTLDGTWSTTPNYGGLVIGGVTDTNFNVISADYRNSLGNTLTTTPATVPEPASVLLTGAGTLSLAVLGWRRRRALS